MGKLNKLIAIAAVACAAPAISATPDSYAKLDKASEAACIKAAALKNASVGPPVRFSDGMLVDVRTIEGTWPQPHMKGAKASMLCVYNRKSKRVEVQEMASAIPVAVADLRDVWWRAEDIGGKGIVGRSEVTLMLGSDGKVGGKSGCNGYSANYMITGETLKVYPPMIGTRMACSPALMKQEQQYQSLLETAASMQVTAQGKLVITSASGATSRFVAR